MATSASVDGARFCRTVGVDWQRSEVAGRAGHRRGRSRAAIASSTLATGIISTSSPAISAAAAMSLVGLPGGDDEVLEPGLAHRRHLLRQATDRPDRAVEVDGAGDGDVVAAEQIAVGQLVEQGQRERQPGARSADLAGVDGDLERQADRVGPSLGTKPMIARPVPRPSTRRQLDVVDGHLALVDTRSTVDRRSCHPAPCRRGRRSGRRCGDVGVPSTDDDRCRRSSS